MKYRTIRNKISMLGITFLIVLFILMASLSPATAAVPIYVVQFNQSSYYVDEDAGYVTLNLSLDRIVDIDYPKYGFVVLYNTKNGTANNVTDFRSLANDPSHVWAWVEFNKGDLFKFIQIPILNDGKYNSPDKYFFMNLTYSCPTTPYVYGANRNVTVTIGETSPPPSIQFEYTNYQVGENSGTTEVKAIMTGTPIGAPITVNYATVDNTAIAGTNYEPVTDSYTFTPGGPTEFTFTVTAKNDGVYSTPDKTFKVRLTGATAPVTLGPDACIQILEAGTQPTVQFATDSYITDENAGIKKVYVTLSGPASDNVIVNYETNPGTALAGVNYTATSSSVTFPAGSTSQEIPVTILDDDIYGGDTFFFVNLTGVSSSNADIGSPDATKITVVDDETQFTIDLYQGWNFISSPLVVEPFMVSHLNQMNQLITRVQKYNNNTLIYDPWMLGAPAEYDFMFYTDLGYMVYAERNTTLTFTGHYPVDRSILLKNAWNSAGWSTFETSDAKSLCALLSGNQRINTFDAIHQVYKPYMEGAPDEYNFNIGPGSGYLIYTDAEVTLDFGGI